MNEDLRNSPNNVQKMKNKEDWFDEKSYQVSDGSLHAFGIFIISRYSKANELSDLLNFASAAAKKNLHTFVRSVFYDSKSQYAEFDLKRDVVQGSDIEQDLYKIACETIAKFLWIDGTACGYCYDDEHISTFGSAIEALKDGKKVARAGWNGKGMWLILVYPSHREILESFSGNQAEYLSYPWIGIKTADNKFLPWQPSQTDILVQDWYVVE